MTSLLANRWVAYYLCCTFTHTPCCLLLFEMVALVSCSKSLKIINLYSACSLYFREFSVNTSLCGKRNFRKFLVYNKRGSKAFREQKRRFPEHDMGVRPPGVWQTTEDGDVFCRVKEMIPEIIVPDLTGFKLKPYVSYRVPDVVQSEFTAKDLFDACYADKILNDFKNNKLTENGHSLEPSLDEQLTPEEAWMKARQTGSDMFYAKLDIEEQT